MPQFTASVAAMYLLSSLLSSHPGKLHIVLRTYDAFGVAAGEMDEARVTVDDLLRSASVHVEWRACPAARPSSDAGEPPCGDLASAELMVRIVAATPATTPSSLGSALLDPGGGVLATVYADRVGWLADRLCVAPGRLLGRVIAHEVGHLLLGAPAHGSRGLMRARWSASEMRNERALDWRWSSQEIMDLARAVESRTPAATANTPVTTTVPTCRSGATCPRR